ncbi:hypothetical protein SAMN05444422_103217 [Halobiforma haloterrestris]|uniref:Uncharacterized protein n=1 Tax=Natronobacterium haloterrestre TaxID=148448 RepID=A0A1I1F8Q4_NATHA|nr:hypothetical protein [Halobiforma haloterrestris]SFB95336.1 hypothetical protein SAMN05444422_103217 [Halobiforma haloterrestris]
MADNDELAEAIRELTRTVDELRRELESSSSRRGSPRPSLRPPTPRELLAFTDEVALPAALAVLKASVRALESFQRGLELVRTEREVRDRADEASTVAGDRAASLRETTLTQLDTVLGQLQRAASEGALPADEEASDLLSEARALRDEVDERLRQATTDRESATDGDASRRPDGWERRSSERSEAISIDIQDGQPEDGDGESDTGVEADSSPEPDPTIDVDAELETLKDQYGPEEKTEADAGEHATPEDESATDVGENEGNDVDPDSEVGSRSGERSEKRSEEHPEDRSEGTGDDENENEE